MDKYLELYRCVVPHNKIINDNHSQHYRIHQGHLAWLTEQFNEILDNNHCIDEEGPPSYYVGPFNFTIPDKEVVNKFINGLNDILNLRCEVWRPREISFDPQNYAKTFKAPIDLLVTNEYLPDDNWKNISSITYTGGGGSVWNKRSWRNGNDNLPEELTIDVWNKIANDYNDLFIRILIF